MSPLLIVGINQVLNFESDPGLKSLTFTELEQIVANGIGIVQVDDLRVPLFLILQVLLGLFT